MLGRTQRRALGVALAAAGMSAFAAQPASAAWYPVDYHFSTGFTDGNAFPSLNDIGTLIEAGRSWMPVDKTFPLKEIAQAHRASETGRIRGRLVLIVS